MYDDAVFAILVWYDKKVDISVIHAQANAIWSL